jgi:hypothetical protein
MLHKLPVVPLAILRRCAPSPYSHTHTLSLQDFINDGPGSTSGSFWVTNFSDVRQTTHTHSLSLQDFIKGGSFI